MNAVSHTTLARVVFPLEDVAEVRDLYICDVTADARAAADIRGRHSIYLGAESVVSLGTYFNAFPSGYWARDSTLEDVSFVVRTRGSGQLRMVASDSGGDVSTVEEIRVDGDIRTEFAIHLARFAQGGACWLEMEGRDGGLFLEDARWIAGVGGDWSPGSVTIGITTFNRAEQCIAQIAAVLGDADVLGILDELIVVDQGDSGIADHPDFAAASKGVGDTLRVLRQPNLGGSGGFARSMLEVVRAERSTYLLLLDDDAISEPESIVRAARFADLARRQVIVGGGMLHLDARTTLYAQSEQWDAQIGWVRLGRRGAYDHDFAAQPFGKARAIHSTQRADFNGWWMCLIPRVVLNEIGLAMPFFLKCDDIEFALRAGRHGVPTVSLPGVAVWHMGWGTKSPTTTWEAYFLHRNRLITGLLHSGSRHGRLLLAHSFLGDIKLVINRQGLAASLRALAATDVLQGPDELPGWLGKRAGEVRAAWAAYQRDGPPGGFLEGFRRAAHSFRLHILLWARWRRLASRYQLAADCLRSPASWEQIFQLTDR